MRALLLAVLAWVALGSTCRAADYYVDDASAVNDQFTTGDFDGAGTGTSADPWSVAEFTTWVETAGTQLNPGDTVWIDALSFDNDSTNGIQITTADDGSAGLPVTIRGARTGSTYYTKIHDTAGTAREYIFYITGSFIVLQDLEISNSRNAGGGNEGEGVQIENATDCQILNCWIHNNESEGILIVKTTAGGALGNHRVANSEIDNNGGQGIQVTRQLSCTIEDTIIRNSGGQGMQVFDESSTAANPLIVRRNRIYSNSSYGIWLTRNTLGPDNVDILDNAIYSNGTYGIVVGIACDNAEILNNWLYQNTAAQVRLGDAAAAPVPAGTVIRNNTIWNTITSADAAGIFVANGASPWTITNNIIYVSGADITGILLANDESGTSNYNDIYATGGAYVGDTNTTSPGLDLAAWQATGRDLNSISLNPQFNDADGADNILGGANGVDDDFHLKSSFGRWTSVGGDAIKGTSDDVFAYDTADSPCIDAGNPADLVGAEAENNGNRINQGVYGGTVEASKSGFYDGTTVFKTWTGKSDFGGEWATGSGGTGDNSNWNNPCNWADRTVPAAGDVVYIPDRGVVTNDPEADGFWEPTLNANSTVVRVFLEDPTGAASGTRDQLRYVLGSGEASLTMAAVNTLTLTATSGDALHVGAGDRLTSAAGTVAATAGGVFTNDGTVSYSLGGANGTIDAPFTNNGTLSCSTGLLPMPNLNFNQNFASPGTLALASDTRVSFGSGGNQSLSETGAGNFANITVNKTAGTLTATSSLTIGGTLTVSGGDFDLNSQTVTVVGTTTISSGSLSIPGGTVTFAGVVSVTGGTLYLGGGTINLDAPPASVSLSTSGSGRLYAPGTATVSRSIAGDPTFSIGGEVDINGLTIVRAGAGAGKEGFQIEATASITNLNGLVIGAASPYGVNFLKTSGSFILRAWTVNNSKSVTPTFYNLKMVAGTATVFFEQSSGPGGGKDTTYGNGLGGEENDSEPVVDEPDPNQDTPVGRVRFTYYKWTWLGAAPVNKLWDSPGTGPGSDDWTNWVWDTDFGPRVADFPNATDADVAVSNAVPANNCVLNVNVSIGNLILESSAGLDDGGAANILSIYGTAFKSSGGTFTPGTGTIRFAGGASQVVIIVGGGAGSFYDLEIAKTAGTTAALKSSLTVSNETRVVSGTLDVSVYTLTQNGAVTVSAGAKFTVPASGVVTRSGAPATNLTVNGTLELSGNAVVNWNAAGTGNVAVNIGGTLLMSGTSRLTVGPVGTNFFGTWSLLDTSTLLVPDGGTVTVRGTWKASGASPGPTVTRSGAGVAGHGFVVEGVLTGTTIDITRLNFSYASLNGFTIDSSVAAVTITNLGNVSFTNVVGADAAPDPASRRRHLYLKGTNGAANWTWSGLSFDATYNGGFSGYNVVTEWGAAFTITMSQSSGSGAGGNLLNPPGGTDTDYDVSESVGLATVRWLRVVTWQGRWRKYRVVNMGGAGGPSQYVFLRVTAATTPTVLDLSGEALNEPDELRIAVRSTGASQWNEVARNVPTFDIPGNLIEVHFKLPADYNAAAGEVRMYYDAASPGAAPALSDPESPMQFLDDFERNYNTTNVVNGWVEDASNDPGISNAAARTGSGGADVGWEDQVTVASMTRAISLAAYYRVQWRYSRRTLPNVVNPDDYYIRYSTNGGAGWTIQEQLTNDAAWADQIVNFAAGSTVENAGGFQIRFDMDRSHLSEDFWVDDVSVRAYKGDVVLQAGTVLNAVNDTTIGGAGLKGKSSEPFHWSDGASPAGLGPPGPDDDVVVDGNGTFPMEVDAAWTIASAKIGENSVSTVTVNGVGLTVNGPAQILGNGTVDGTGAGVTLVVNGDLTVAGIYSCGASVTVGGEFAVQSGGTFTLASAKTLRLTRAGTSFPPGVHPIDGLLRLTAGDGATKTTVEVGDFQQIEVGATGTLRTLSGPGPNGYSFNNEYVHFIRAGGTGGYSIHAIGTVDIAFVKFEFLYRRSTAGRDEFTQGTVESAFALSGGGASLTQFSRLWFESGINPAGPNNARFPRYLYLLGDIDNDGVNENSFNGYGSPSFFSRIRFEGTGGLPDYQSNVEKRAQGDVVRFQNGVGGIGGLANGDANDMDGDRDPPVFPAGGDPGIDDIIFENVPTAVLLADLWARGYDATVLVEWRTAQEVDNLGFNVYRSRFPDRDWVQVNPGMILGMGDSQVGGRYYFLDRTVANGVRYYYMLEDVDFRGTRSLSGPVDALPLAGLGQPLLNDADYVNHGSAGDAVDTVPTSGRDVPPPLPAGRESDWTLAEKLLGIDLAAAGIRLISLDETGALIEILPPEPTITPEMWDGKLQTRISMASYSATRVLGMPEVPTKGILLVTPEIERATARILEVDSRSLSGVGVVRTRPPGIAGRTGAGRSGGGASSGTRSRPRSLTVMEMIAEAREELMARILAKRQELVEARKKGREALANRGRPGKGGAGGGVGGGPGGAAARAGGTGGGAGVEIFPGSLVGLGGLTRHLGRQLLPIQINPVQVAGGRVDVYRRILVRIDFIGARPPIVETPGAGEGLFDTPTQIALAANGSALKVVVKEDGLYRLARADLAGAGLDVSGDPRTIRMYNLGREVAIRVSGEIDGVFDDGDEVVFYGAKNPWRLVDNPEATRHTDENVYWLTMGVGFGTRMEEVWMRPVDGATAAADHAATLHSETNFTFYPRLVDGTGKDHWFNGTTFFNAAGENRPTARANFTLGLPALSGMPHTARLEVALAGVTDYDADPDHKVVVSVNGQVLGDARWNGRLGHREVFEFPSSLLLAGDNTVELYIPCDLPGVANDQVLLNYLRLSYRRLLVAESDRVFFTGDAGGEFEVTGFASAEVGGADISDPTAPRWIRGMAVSGGAARFNDSVTRAGGRYALAGSAALRSPDRIERNSPSSWHDGTNRADWIGVAHGSLLAGVAPLADHRRSQGLVTAAADVTDLYDEWTAGIPDPLAIRAFVAHARARWAGPAPRYALLVGDGSFDSHGYRWPGSDFVPAPLGQMEILWTASDVWYAAVEGDDMLPDLAIGRLAVRTPEALAAAVEKILAHETGPAEGWHRQVSLVADNDDAAYDFSRAVAGYADLFGPDYDVEEVQLGELGTTETRNRTRAALNAGRLLVGYMGHGSAVAWANENLFHANDVASLTNDGRYGLVTALGCMNGMYHLPQLNCLGEVVVSTERRGGMAFWGSTSLVNPAPQEEVYRELIPLLFGGSGLTLGEAVTEAELLAWTGGWADEDVLRAWVLLGDPATRLR